jgi:hypothetical protein
MDKVSLIESRMGLALTDCTFMCSENKDQWYRFEEAQDRLFLKKTLQSFKENQFV